MHLFLFGLLQLLFESVNNRVVSLQSLVSSCPTVGKFALGLLQLCHLLLQVAQLPLRALKIYL